MDEVTKDSSSSDHREAIRERLKQIRELLRVSRYRRTPAGTATIDEPTVGGKPRESDTTREPGESNGGSRGGRAGDIYALFALADGEPGEEVISDFTPRSTGSLSRTASASRRTSKTVPQSTLSRRTCC
jgi:hypothetical protein